MRKISVLSSYSKARGIDDRPQVKNPGNNGWNDEYPEKIANSGDQEKQQCWEQAPLY